MRKSIRQKENLPSSLQRAQPERLKGRLSFSSCLLAISLAFVVSIAGCIGQLPTGQTIENIQTIERPDYENLSSSVFSSLPAFPADFADIDRQVSMLNMTILPGLPESYYRQPEFYPTWEQLGTQLFRNHPTDKIAIWGLGAYPADQSFALKEGEEATAAAFFHSSWLVQTFQGVKLSASYDASALDVTIENQEFLLGPNWPAFDKGWVQKISVKIKAKRSGSYIVGISTGQPSAEAEQDWRSALGGSYVNAPSATPDRPFVKIAVNVE